MMHLNLTTENWRELLTDEIDAAERAAGVDADQTFYNEFAEALRDETLRRLTVDYSRAHQQSVGAFEIIQSGTAEERAAFDAALESAKPAVVRLLNQAVADLAVVE